MVTAIVLLAAMAPAQAPANSCTSPKTGWGDPDIQGTNTRLTDVRSGARTPEKDAKK